jgi:cardiolipin synthase
MRTGKALGYVLACKMPVQMHDKTNSKPKPIGFRLLVQPDAGVDPLVAAIDKSRQRVDILIFRFDSRQIEEALIRAVARGVAVQALIAWTNHGGERNLRQLETRLLAGGVTVSRTASDLARYHGKMMLIDRKQLYLLAFNFTALDIDRSRSFGIVTTSPRLVLEAARLFDADCARQPYTPGLKAFLVSPLNARSELAAFLEGAKKDLLIYDPGLCDPQMIRVLEERGRAGVKIRVIGTMKRPSPEIAARPLSTIRLHTRTIIRDGKDAFVGSQSLRALELDGRREVGVIVSNSRVVKGIARVFEDDWKAVKASNDQLSQAPLLGDKLARKVAKAMTRELPSVSEVMEGLASDLSPRSVTLEGVDLEALEETVRAAVKTAVKETIQEAASRPPVPA